MHLEYHLSQTFGLMGAEMLRWFRAQKSEAFGSELAVLVQDNLPLKRDISDAKWHSKSNYAKEKMLKRIKQFKQSERLNVYKTAKLLNAFKWDLKDAGYDDKVVESFASWILVSLQTSAN